MTATELLSDIARSLTSPMRTYKENATEDAPKLVAALDAVLALAEDYARIDSEQITAAVEENLR